ncbi:MAG TPA: hypothetical protein VF155_00625 [Candidatus Dormibacteraeota bacterium]
MLAHLPVTNAVHVDAPDDAARACGANACEITPVAARVMPAQHDNVILGDHVVDGPARIECAPDEPCSLFEPGQSGRLAGKCGVVDIVDRRHLFQRVEVTVVEDARLVAAQQRLIGVERAHP